MDRPTSFFTPPCEVDLDSTRSRLLLAREQCASQSSIAYLRSVGAMRSWQTRHWPSVEQADPEPA